MSASGTIKIYKHDSRICAYDNGTEVCDKGHKLKTIGLCFSQPIGVYNSTDDTFQPTYSICSSDYAGLTNSGYSFFLRAEEKNGTCKVLKDSESSANIKNVLKSYEIDKSEWVAVKSLSKSPFDATVLVWSDSIVGYCNEYLDSYFLSGTQKVLQHDSGWVMRTENSVSDYFQLDTNGFITLVLPYVLSSKREDEIKIIKQGDTTGSYNEVVDTTKGSVTNPTLDPYGAPYENPEEICVGDLVAPTLENIYPDQSAHLVDPSSVVRFNVVDAIGGVDKSSVYITVSGNLTAQEGVYTVVDAGVEQVGSASFTGTENNYYFVYTPPSVWTSNEVVTVTVTGTDLVPEVDGSPFSCYGGDPNPFGYNWTFQIQDYSAFAATITAIADSWPPYLENIAPTPYFGDSDAFTDISFDIVDDHAGVDLSTLFVYVNGVAVVSYGVSQSSLASITGTQARYTFIYDNSAGLSYGSRVVVRVVVDDLYALAPNTLDQEYYYDIVGTSSLVIANFYPEVGITWDPNLIDIGVDVYDSTFDVDQSVSYLSINGERCLSTETDLFGNRNLTTAVSGLDCISGTWFNDATASGTSITGTTIAGSAFFGGFLTDGDFFGGQIGSFPAPFDLTSSADIIMAYAYEGTVVSGTTATLLVSGVNWDGKATNSTITGVDVESFYATNVSSSGTVISGTVGVHYDYHPLNDFDFGCPINVTVHAENKNSIARVKKESLYQLLYGYNVKVFDREYNHNSKINVYIRARNKEEFTNELTEGFYFTTIDQPYNDFTASITGIAPWEDITASIAPQAPVHRYGETITIEIYAEDLEGNALGPYTFSYTIESE